MQDTLERDSMDEGMNPLDPSEQAQERISHLESVLRTVADLLEVNQTPENVERAIRFIRTTLQEETHERTDAG
jgi:uncharacterized protein (UPF0147 family)